MSGLEWECPECNTYNPIPGEVLKGLVKCFDCDRTFKLEGLAAHGFIFEISDESRKS